MKANETTHLPSPAQWEADVQSDVKKVLELSQQIEMSDPQDAEQLKHADGMRKALKKLRTAIEARRKELTAPALQYQRDLKKVADTLMMPLRKRENQIQAFCDEAARIEEEKKREQERLRQEEMNRRLQYLKELRGYVDHGAGQVVLFDGTNISLAEWQAMPPEEFDAYIAKVRPAIVEEIRQMEVLQQQLKEKKEAEARAAKQQPEEPASATPKAQQPNPAEESAPQVPHGMLKFARWFKDNKYVCTKDGQQHDIENVLKEYMYG